MLTQIARSRGARVLATVGNEEKARLAREAVETVKEKIRAPFITGLKPRC